jgi:BMFP domain-containing protein YqiC
MATPQFFDDLSARLADLIAASPAKDIEKNLRATLAGFFSRLDLVTREEFEVQAKVLARTRERLEALEARVRELERREGSSAGDASSRDSGPAL